MPHAALIALAVTAGVGGAIAFEVGVFKPWRDEHWPNGFAQGIKQEWELFAEDVREGFREISGDRTRHQYLQQQHLNHNHRYRRHSNEEEERELRREMDEFSLHEAQSSSVRTRLTEEFEGEQSGGAQRRRLQGAVSSEDVIEDRVSTV